MSHPSSCEARLLVHSERRRKRSQQRLIFYSRVAVATHMMDLILFLMIS